MGEPENIYPKTTFPAFDMNNYRINHIMNQYKYLDEERKTRSNLKKKYDKLSAACFGTDFFITVSELGIVGTSIALPVMIPFSVPVSVTLTACLAILRSTNGFITKKISKHSKIELLAKTKLNSIEEKFTKAIKDGEITDEEFNDIEQEIKNYENMKSNILNEYKVNNDLIDKVRTEGGIILKQLKK
jgi:hypothetical protein